MSQRVGRSSRGPNVHGINPEVGVFSFGTWYVEKSLLQVYERLAGFRMCCKVLRALNASPFAIPRGRNCSLVSLSLIVVQIPHLHTIMSPLCHWMTTGDLRSHRSSAALMGRKEHMVRGHWELDRTGKRSGVKNEFLRREMGVKRGKDLITKGVYARHCRQL